jgi:hypothetical protein
MAVVMRMRAGEQAGHDLKDVECIDAGRHRCRRLSRIAARFAPG